MRKKIRLKNKEISYILKKSARAKRVRISINCNADVTLTFPKHTGTAFAESFLLEKFDWVFEKISSIRKSAKRKTYTKKDYLENKELARKIITEKIERLNSFYKYDFKNISIRDQKTRWGSCSKNKNLNFNYKLIYLPEEISDYIIIHELCHLKEFNHSKSFWSLVEKTVPNFKNIRKKLKEASI